MDQDGVMGASRLQLAASIPADRRTARALSDGSRPLGAENYRRSASFNGRLPTVRRSEAGTESLGLTPQHGPRQVLLSQTGVSERLEGLAAVGGRGL